MRLNLGQLQAVVKRTIDEEKAVEALRGEIKRVLGPSVVTEGRLETVVAEANDRIDVLQRTGRDGRMDFVANITTAFLDHNHPEVRRFAARVVPEHFLGRLASDKDSAVRAAVAQRAPLPIVREMMKGFKNDDALRTIYRQRRKLLEAGIAQPKVVDEPFDMHGEERLGDNARTAPGPELSEAWYDQQARTFMNDYGQNIEYAWEELAVNRFCKSVKATSGVEIDEVKLLKSIKGLIKDKEDLAMERNTLKETLGWLEEQARQEALQESVLPELNEVDDPVHGLVSAGLTNEQFIEQAMGVFRIQEASLPTAIRKYRLGEGNKRVTQVPIVGWLPHGGSFRAVDERALDRFCECWNRRQALAGEPIKLQWVTHPSDMSKVGFSASLS